MTKRLVIIDGKSVFYRGYYAMPFLSTKDGTPTGGVYGFASLSLELIKKLKPDYVCVAWDKRGTNIRRRKELYPAYKAGRKPAPPDFYEQIPILIELLEALSWPLYEADDYEADDIMGTLAVKAAEQGIESCLITSDLDLLQCVGPLTHVYAMKKGLANIELYNPEAFEEKYGLRVDQFIDLKSLEGDSSDNIPGVPGIGEKGAIKLLQAYETLDGVYEHVDEIPGAVGKKLIAGKQSAYLSRKLAEIWCDAPVELDLEATDVNDLDTGKLKQILMRLEFKSLLGNLPKSMQQTAESPTEQKAIVLEPVVVAPLDDQSQVELTMAELVMIHPAEKGWLASPEPSKAIRLTSEQATGALAGQSIAGHGVKPFLKALLSAGATELPRVAHDTEQAAFLIDPLNKFRGVNELAGGEVPTAEHAISALWNIYKAQTDAFADNEKLAYVAQQIDFALIPVLARMEHRGILLSSEQLARQSQSLGASLEELKHEMYEMAGYEFNIGSPAQLADVLYGKLQLSTAGVKRGKTGFSTGQKELDKLRGLHPIIEKIEQYREVSKLKSTYTDALPKLVDDQGRLHTDFRQDVASTGRLSSAEPNLQNIPIRTELGRKIRQAFVPADGNVFVSADYSQFELRLAAVLAGDTEMINDFNSDIDIHAKTASDVYKVPLSEVTKSQRRDAKVINFGVLYGMGPHALAQNTGMSFSEAKMFIDEYFRLRAPIRRYIDATIHRAKTEGYVETLFGRRRPTPDVTSSNFVVRSAAERQAANMPIQGTEADLMKLAMLAVEDRLGKDNLGVQVLQIHDSILVECLDANARAVDSLLRDTMENIYPDLGVKLKVDTHTGKNWGEV